MIAYEIDPSSAASVKIVKAARKMQQEAMTASGLGVVTQTIEMRVYWIHVCKRIATAGSTGKPWHTVIEIAEHRQWCMVWLRAQTACRPQDLFGFLNDIERFSDTNWLDSDSVGIRFLNGKDTHDDSMNAWDRPLGEEQQGQLTSLITLHRVSPPENWQLPDGFAIIHWYKMRLGEAPGAPRHSVTLSHGGTVEHLRLRRFFLGIGFYSNSEIKRATISSQTKKSLIEAGAIPDGSPLQAEHLRHTALSAVYFALPERLSDALLRSRHSRDVFLRNYDLTIAPKQRDAFESLLPADLSVDLLMLG